MGPHPPRRDPRRLAVLLALSGAVLATACIKKPAAPPHAAAHPAPALTAWPQGHTPPLKITDELTLEIPLQYERSAISRDRAPARALLSVQSDRAEAQFDFFLPALSGYTLQNYRNDTDPNKVEVVYLHAGDTHEADPGAPGEFPPNMLKRALEDYLSPDDYRDEYGLRCYRGRVPTARLTCYGRRDAAGEDIMLTTLLPPYAADAFPQMQARYYTRRYGGVRIAWRTHVSNLPRWHEIDAQIWKFIDTWKVAPATPAGPTVPAGPAAPAAPAGNPRP